jgi:hypothetical protein
MSGSIQTAVSTFGRSANQKLGYLAASGELEDKRQLRTPIERLSEIAELVHIPRGKVATVGESSLRDLKPRSDYAVTIDGALAVAVTRNLTGAVDAPTDLFRDH